MAFQLKNYFACGTQDKMKVAEFLSIGDASLDPELVGLTFKYQQRCVADGESWSFTALSIEMCVEARPWFELYSDSCVWLRVRRMMLANEINR